MAIVKAVRPTVLVTGTVQSVEPRYKKGTAELLLTSVTVLTPSGGQTEVDVWDRPGVSVELPPVLGAVCIVAEISVHPTYGASFGFVRYSTDNDVDLVVSAHGSLVGSK